SEDPLGFAGGDVNLYAYVGSSPTNFTDPFGFSVDARTFADCVDTLLEAGDRQEQMVTGGRKDPVEKVVEAVGEINRTIWDVIGCLSPVALGMAAGGGKPPLKPEVGPGPLGRR